MSNRKRSPQPVKATRLVGMRVVVMWAQDRDLVGTEGEVCHETARSILIRTSSKVKRLLKDGLVLNVETPRGWQRIEFWSIKGRPYER